VTHGLVDFMASADRYHQPTSITILSLRDRPSCSRVSLLTRRRVLIRQGVSRRQAIRHARNRKDYWHMAKTIASGVGMTNKWLEKQGLIRPKQLWSDLAPCLHSTQAEPPGADPHARRRGVGGQKWPTLPD